MEKFGVPDEENGLGLLGSGGGADGGAGVGAGVLEA